MGKEFSPKLHTPERRQGVVPWAFATVGLCFFFYILGAWQQQQQQQRQSIGSVQAAADATNRVQLLRCPPQSSSSSSSSNSSSNSSNSSSSSNRSSSSSASPSKELDFGAHHDETGEDESSSSSSSGSRRIEACGMKMSEYTPCEDIDRSLKFSRERLVYRERHCPAGEERERTRCLVPAPRGYRNPFRWPASREWAWYANVPHKELTVEKAVQNWIQFRGDRFRFPGGGTMFPRGAAAYIDDIAAILPDFRKGRIRTALDTGCGVASFGAYLLSRGVLTMSFAPRDTHEGQVQFALERGVPAMLGVMASQRLMYPARSFDLAHCSRCLIPWKDYDGLFLMEVDRVLRPGGYWILSGPPVNWKTHWKSWERTQEDLSSEMEAIEEVARRMCWKKVAEKGNVAIWQKPSNHFDCLRVRRNRAPMCAATDSPDYAWYKPMEACVSPMPAVGDKAEVAGGEVAAWPERVSEVPPRVRGGGVPGVTTVTFAEDAQLWASRVAHYRRAVVPPLGQGRYRNVMDMDAGLGGFAAALSSDERVWVMNAVHPNATAHLAAIYERGFIGVYHDWCEAFSTYPRTYDLLHANRIFSFYKPRCDLVDILVEMDRILRPEGTVIMRDEVDVLNAVQGIVSGMRWETKMFDHEDGPFNREKILVAVKTYWVGGAAGGGGGGNDGDQ